MEALLPPELHRQLIYPFKIKMAEATGFEPAISGVTGRRVQPLRYASVNGGRNRARTCDPLLVRQVLSQLSYSPMAPSRGFEPLPPG